MEDKKYLITDINRLRINSDGQGISTVIFLSGCPLKCKYCINPNTWQSKDGKYYSVQELFDEIKLDRPYMMATNGGFTFGGGEPLLQYQLIQEFRKED